MNKEILSNAIGNIDTGYILEADSRTGRPKGALRSKGRFRNAAAACAVFLLCFSLTLSVLAARVETIYQVLYAVNPTIAQSLKPVQTSCESNGVRMEVISAKVEGAEAWVYVSMQDLEGDRIDQTIDLFDSYDIHLIGDQTGTCSFLGYDENAKAATFLITVSRMDGKEIPRGKMTFSVGQFLSHKTEFQGPVLELGLIEIPEPSDIQTKVDIRGGDEAEAGKYLIPESPAICSPADGTKITAIGFIDGQLHIQVHFENILQYDNHGRIYLADGAGERLYPEVETDFWDEEHKGSYQEAVFPVSPENAPDYTLEGVFTTCGTLVQGSWQVTFSLDN